MAFLKSLGNAVKIKFFEELLKETPFEIFVEKYHSFVFHVRAIVALVPTELRALIHLNPLEAVANYELTMVLKAPPTKTAGLFAQYIMLPIQNDPNLRNEVMALAHEWETTETIPMTKCESLVLHLVEHFMKDEEDVVIAKIKSELHQWFVSEEKQVEKHACVMKVIRFLDIFLLLVQKPPEPVVQALSQK